MLLVRHVRNRGEISWNSVRERVWSTFLNKEMFLVTEECLNEKHRHGVEFQHSFSVSFS